MALVLKDRVKETSVSTGTGAISLAGATGAYQPFSVIGNGNQTYYAIAGQTTNEWEVGIGTYTLSTDSISRDTILSSSNSNAIVNFSAGTKDVFITYPSEKAIYEEPSGETLINAGPITVIGAGVTSIPSLPAELGKFIGDVDSFAQIYTLNQNDGATASADFVAYNDLTTDGFTYFTDMGISSSNYTSLDYPLFTPNSGYVFHQGGDFYLGNQTTNKDVVIFSGGVDVTDVVATFSGTDRSTTLEADLNVGGALDVTGAASFGSTVLLDANPTLALQAATKQYVDNAVTAGVHIHEPVRVVSASNLTATYAQGGTTFNITTITSTTTVTTSVNHGLSVNDQIWLTSTAGNGLSTNTAYFVYSTPALNQLTLSLTFGGAQITGLTNATGLTYATRANSGVGATLTNSGAQAALSIDGVSLSSTNRVLVRGQTSAAENGVYTVTTVGSGSTNWVLTRATDSNTVNPSDPDGLGTGDYFFVQEGLTGTGDSFVLTTEPNTMIIGYTALTYTQFSGAITYVGGTNIDVTGQTISLTGTVAATNGGTGTSTVTTGDLLYGSATNTWSKLPVGAAYRSLVVNSGGTQVEWNAVALNQAGAVSGSLGATNGGTGQTGYTLGDTLYSSATDTLTKLAGNTSTTKQYLSQTGTGSASAAPSWATISAADIGAGTLPAVRGGTGQSSYAIGDLLYADTTTTLAKLAATATGRVLISNGTSTAPSWSTSISIGAITGTSITDSGLTSGRVTFAGTGGELSDSANFVWDNSNTRLGIGTGSPTGLIQLTGSTWRKGVLETTGVTAKAYQGSDSNGLNFTSNIYWSGSAWVQDDATKACFAYIQHLGNSRMEFRVAPAGAFPGWTTAMVIDTSGNTGIGVTTPGQKLTVAQGAKATTATALTTVGFETTDTTGTQFGLYFRQKTDATAANRWTGIQSFDNGVGASNLVLQDLGGRVGIATTTPRQQLSVGANLDLYSGSVNSPTVPSVRGSAGNNLILSGFGSGAVFLNFDGGTGGVNFCNGAGSGVASVSSSGGLSATTGSFSGQVSGKTAGTDATPSFYAVTTGGAYSSMYNRRGCPFTSAVSQSGSSYAPSVSMIYNHNSAYDGVYSIGVLSESAANPGAFNIHHINSSGGLSFAWQFQGSTGNFSAPGSVSGTNITAGGNVTGSSTSCTGNAATATSSTSLNSSHFISRTGSSGNANTDFQNTPAGTTRLQGDDANLSNSPGNTWWFYQNMRHSNSSNFWGTQVAWGWEDNANRLATRNITGGSFGSWVYYLNSANFTSYAPSLTGSGASGTWGINVTGNSATTTRLAGDIYISPSNVNTMNGAFGTASDAGDMWINYRGFNDGFAYFRTLSIGNGKGVQIAGFDGPTGSFLFNSGYGAPAVAYGCRVWVNFNGQGTIAIRGSGNVSSLTDNGVGRYAINFASAMPDTNYNCVGSCSSVSGRGQAAFMVNETSGYSVPPTTTSVTVLTYHDAGGQIDPQWVMASVFR